MKRVLIMAAMLGILAVPIQSLAQQSGTGRVAQKAGESSREAPGSTADTLPWGADVKDFPDLAKYKSADGIDYYHALQEKESPLFSGNPAQSVLAFKNGKLYAYLVEITHVKGLEQHLRVMVKAYGEPEQKMEGDSRIYQWKSGVEKIKLKHNERTGEMKLGIYYAPKGEPEWIEQ